jgi:predicted alpha/beta-fold hydrolase
LAVVFFAVLATMAIAGFLVYRIVKPQRTSSEINMASFPGRPETLDFEVPGLGKREGWFFPGLRGAPTVLLLHGYESSRGELLTLVSALQDHQYNVFVFDFAAHGANDGVTTLGYREADEVRAAVDLVAARIDVDPTRFGLWGYNLGAYAALREAEGDKRDASRGETGAEGHGGLQNHPADGEPLDAYSCAKVRRSRAHRGSNSRYM